MSQPVDWQTLNENERKKLIQKGQLEVDNWKRKIDEKQKLLCEKRETIPSQCEHALIKERMTLLEHFMDGELFIPRPHKPNLDSQLVIEEIQNQLQVDESNTVTEKVLEEEIGKITENTDEINMKCIEFGQKLLSMRV